MKEPAFMVRSFHNVEKQMCKMNLIVFSRLFPFSEQRIAYFSRKEHPGLQAAGSAFRWGER